MQIYSYEYQFIDIVRVYFGFHSFKPICFWKWRRKAWAIVRFHRQFQSRVHMSICTVIGYCQWIGIVFWPYWLAKSFFAKSKSFLFLEFSKVANTVCWRGQLARARSMHFTRSMNWPATALNENDNHWTKNYLRINYE